MPKAKPIKVVRVERPKDADYIEGNHRGGTPTIYHRRRLFIGQPGWGPPERVVKEIEGALGIPCRRNANWTFS